MKIALVGATGNVAGRALAQLVQAGAQTVALVRHPEKLPESLRARVHVEQGDLEDGAFVVRATRGADALLWLTPTTFSAADFRAYTLGLARNAAQALQQNGIQRVVFVSSHGADRSGLGQVSFAGEVEKILEAVAPHTVSLRSAGFMENLFASVGTLKQGQLFTLLPPDKKYPLVATRDVGDVAARWLRDSTWTGHHLRGVHGPEDLSAQDLADILGRVLGRPVRCQQVPQDSVRDAFLERGASPSVADGYFHMFRSFAHKDYQPTEPRTAETTTPTTFETFVRESLSPRLQ
ncbi:NmrA family NAD(P)-binding protein [Corallococcus llansteffanensis]|uniref:NAD-dependent epimerase/dehydratase family protein n=1 Tax=Corallococcus llansteffanensis TaxID=2316731 RepID=A0A3A8QDJ0_9BACT|nr:NAD(P)H-binding protein [Corallococcus llansteffanensis]RKH61284.1 NAD-dependent epimerase/dehydratase family protein [Corallococcus llansteffanensis]